MGCKLGAYEMRFFLTILMLVVAFNALSQNFVFTNLTKKDGLAANQVTCFEQTPDGFIWVGTRNGLNRFDGRHFKLMNYEQSPAIPPTITDLESNGHDELWIGTQDGLCRLSLTTDSLKLFSPSNTLTLLSRLIHDVAISENGQVWVAADNQDLLAFRPADNSFEAFPWRAMVRSAKISTKSYLNINRILPAENGLVWLCTNIGLFSFHEKSKVFKHYPMPSSIKNLELTYVIPDGQGGLWLATGGQGVRHFDGKNGWADFPYRPDAAPLTDDFTQWGFTILDKDKLMVGTSEGVGVFDIINHSWQIVRHDPEVQYSLLPGRVLSFLKDNDGSIWVAVQGGISRLDAHLQQIPFVKTHEEKSRVISFVLEDEGRYYLTARSESPLYMYESANQKLTTFNLPNGKKLDYPRQLVDDGQGNIWVIDFHHIYKFDKKKQRFQPLPSPINLPGYGSNIQFSTAELDGKGRLWLGTHTTSLLVLDTKTGLLESVKHNAEGTYGEVRDLWWDDEESVLWLTSWSGFLGKYHPETGVLEKIETGFASEMTTRLAATSDGQLWITTEPGGITHLEKKGTQIEMTNFYVQDGLPVNKFQDIETDDKNRPWLICQEGICLFDAVQKTTRCYGSEFGVDLPDWGIRLSKSYHGNLLVGGYGGFYVLNPVALKTNPVMPIPVLTSIKVLDKEQIRSLPEHHFSLDLPSNRNFISFSFAAPQYVLSDKVKFSYRLEGIDQDWVDAGEQLTAQYPKLSHGSYRFRVRATDMDGQINEMPNPVSIKIRPHFTQTIWFKLAVFAVVFAIGYGFYRYRIRQLLAVQQMRNKIAADLHDDVASTISSISFYSDFVKQQLGNEQPKLEAVLEKIGNNAREAMQNIREIVWTVDARSDRSEHFASKVQDIGQSACSAKGVVFEFSNQLPANLELPPQIRKNIFLIYKEAVNNTLKYAEARKLSVRIWNEGRFFNMTISDDGKGFDSHLDTSGNGIRNMRLRALENKATLQIYSNIGAGTQISYSIRIG